jgi:cation transporter-like permease
MSGLMVAVFGVVIGNFIFDVEVTKLMIMTLLAVGLIGAVMFPSIASFTLITKKLGMNPDNIVGPIQSSIIDVVAIFVIALVVSTVA